MAEATFAFDLHVLSTPPAFNLSQNQTLQFKSVQRFLLGRNQNLKVLFPLALHLSMNQKKSFSLPPFFAAFVNMLFCHRFVNNFFGNLQKTFCEGFLKPRCFMRRGKLLRSSLMPVNSFFLFFPEIFFPEPSEKCCFSGGERDFYAFSPGVSIPLEHFSKKAILTGAIRGPEPFHDVRLYLLSRSPSCCTVFPFIWIFR